MLGFSSAVDVLCAVYELPPLPLCDCFFSNALFLSLSLSLSLDLFNTQAPIRRQYLRMCFAFLAKAQMLEPPYSIESIYKQK